MKKSYNPAKDIPNLSGKVVLVTGGNAGIGYHTVKHLLRHGAKVYMGARSQQRANAAIEQLQADGALDGTGQVEWTSLDLATPSTAQAGAEEFLRRSDRLDVLINNAGVFGLSTDFDRIPGNADVCQLMSVNHLGSFVLTSSLYEILKKTAAEPNSDVRVINISSELHRRINKVDWKDPNWAWTSKGNMDGLTWYGTTKLANILFTRELQRRFDADGINAITIAVQPGIVWTDGNINWAKQFGIMRPIVSGALRLISITPEEGSYNTLWAATSPIVQEQHAQYAGQYIVPIGSLSKVSAEVTDENIRDCWDTSSKVVAKLLE